MADPMPTLKVVHHDLGVDKDIAYIIPISDLHIGANFNEGIFLKYRQWILDHPEAYCVILGDVIDNAITGSIGDTYESLRPKQQKELALKFLEPLAKAGKILGWVEGNHELRSTRQTDEYVGEYLTKMLGIPSVYDPDGLYMFLSVGHDRQKGKQNRNVYTLFMLHGYTGSRKMGGKANSLEDMKRGVHAEVFLVAHSHQKIVFPTHTIMPDLRLKRIRYVKSMHIMAGSFIEWAGYAVRKGYMPTPMGSPKLILNGTHHAIRCSV
jgi:hypothetical protein